MKMNEIIQEDSLEGREMEATLWANVCNLSQAATGRPMQQRREIEGKLVCDIMEVKSKEINKRKGDLLIVPSTYEIVG